MYWNSTEPRPTISSPSAVSSTQLNYDPEACAFVKKDISITSALWRYWYQSIAWDDKYAIQGAGPLEQISHTITTFASFTEVIRRPMLTQCDGRPRVSSIGKVVRSSTWSYVDLTLIKSTRSGAPPEPTIADPNLLSASSVRSAQPAYPTCYIRPEHCQGQWNLLTSTF
jgi:hypothetical protein